MIIKSISVVGLFPASVVNVLGQTHKVVYSSTNLRLSVIWVLWLTKSAFGWEPWSSGNGRRPMFGRSSGNGRRPMFGRSWV